MKATKKTIQEQVHAVIQEAYEISRDMGREVEAALAAGREHPLGEEELRALLDQVVTEMQRQSEGRGEASPFGEDASAVVDRLIERAAVPDAGRVELQAKNSIAPGPVFPTPMFHGKEVPMRSGWAATREINLWEDNERLEIHVDQFKQVHGRGPKPAELLDLMMSKLPLRGIDEEDQFDIASLARSIATNGVRKPPIIALDGTLLDGNRRVTACNYILASDEFGPEQKKRAEHIFVWQLTEHATDDDHDRVVVALNFEPDYKKDWPEYIKARKVHEEWQAILNRELTMPNSRRQAQLKRELSMRFALGPTTNVVNRYLKMMNWADQFEAYHVDEKGRDAFEVKHRTEEAFQYFDELGKGLSEGGVAYHLGRDDPFRHAVFDLLLDGRFRNWRQIRDLKHIADNEDARDLLLKARDELHADEAEEKLDQAITIAKARNADTRKVGANTRIETFVKWLVDVPVGSFTDGTIKPANLTRLLEALERVEKVAAEGLTRGVDDD